MEVDTTASDIAAVHFPQETMEADDNILQTSDLQISQNTCNDEIPQQPITLNSENVLKIEEQPNILQVHQTDEHSKEIITDTSCQLKNEKRKHIIKEILNTEKSYVATLQEVQNVRGYGLIYSRGLNN